MKERKQIPMQMRGLVDFMEGPTFEDQLRDMRYALQQLLKQIPYSEAGMNAHYQGLHMLEGVLTKHIVIEALADRENNGGDEEAGPERSLFTSPPRMFGEAAAEAAKKDGDE